MAKVKEREQTQAATQVAPQAQPELVTCTVYAYTGGPPVIAQVPKGTTVAKILAQAGIKVEANKEVYLNDKLCSAETVVEVDGTLLYTVRVAGGVCA